MNYKPFNILSLHMIRVSCVFATEPTSDTLHDCGSRYTVHTKQLLGSRWIWDTFPHPALPTVIDLYYTVKQQYARPIPAHVLLIKAQLGSEQRIWFSWKNRSTEQQVGLLQICRVSWRFKRSEKKLPSSVQSFDFKHTDRRILFNSHLSSLSDH